MVTTMVSWGRWREQRQRSRSLAAAPARWGALRAGNQTGTLDSFKDALTKPSRGTELLKVIRYDRALAYDAAGQQARAKQDLERIFAHDPGYLDVRERLIQA